MKLATLRNGSRDGELVVVSKDLTRYAEAASVAATLQTALDDWAVSEPKLRALADQVEAGSIATKPFQQSACESPLPRAYQWLDGSAYINHVELVRQARGAEMPPSFYTDPLMYQGNSDANLGPYDDIPSAGSEWGTDMEAEIAVIIDDVPMGVSEAKAEEHIKLVMLCNDVSLRGLIPGELGKGFGFVQSKPACAFTPVCVTPDELGEAWQNSCVHLPMEVDYNDTPFGRANAGKDVTFSMARLIAHAAKTRRLSAGTIIGSGTVSNKGEDGGPGKPVSEGGLGYSCIAELRMIEVIETGAPVTPFMSSGDTVRIEMHDKLGQSVFGAIKQRVSRV